MKGAGRKWKTERLDELKETTAVEWLNEQLKCTLTISQMYDVVITDLFKEAKEMEKEQAKRMYSEEEVFKLICNFNYDLQIDECKDIKEWFEQFKKKVK